MTLFLKNKYVWIVLILIVAGGVFFSQKTKKSEVSNIGKATRGDLIQRVTISGTVIPNRKTMISAPYSGYVKNLFVQIGSQVKAGDPIVSLAQSLNGSSDDVFPLRAPFAGTVVQVLRSVGEYVEQQGSPSGNGLVRIDDLTQMFVEATAPEIEVGKIKIKQEAMIKASAILNRSYKGRIQNISLAAKEQKDWDKSRVEFPILIAVTDSDPMLKSGMSVIIDIITHKLTGVLTLKHEYIQKDGNQYFVVTEKGDKKPIEVGAQNEEVFEIRSGITENEKVRLANFLSILQDE